MVNRNAILIGVFLLVLVILLYRYITIHPSLTSITSATVANSVSSSSAGISLSTNYAYSIWFFINDWNYNQGNIKIVFAQMASATCPSNNQVSLNEGSLASTYQINPGVFIDKYSNKLSVGLKVNTAPSASTQYHYLENIPLQKWVHFVMSVNGTTLDLYLDGKLTNTVVLKAPAYAPSTNTNSLYVTPCGGFNGWTSNLQYFPHPLNPQEVWNIYRKGYNGSSFGNFFKQFQLVVTVNKNGVPTNTFTI